MSPPLGSRAQTGAPHSPPPKGGLTSVSPPPWGGKGGGEISPPPPGGRVRVGASAGTVRLRPMKTVIAADPPVNQAPPDLDPSRDLPRGFYDFLAPLHRAFTPRQQELAARRRQELEAARGGKLPGDLA